MLGTRERTLLLEGLRPPPGYRLRRAVGTSFVLDLMALLTVPLAFTYFDAHDDDGSPISNPVALLHALRKHAGNVAVFCQAGAIGVPHSDQPMLAFIEESVIPVLPPTDGGIFHPKVWVLNFESGCGPPVYRVLCLSRNLTFARAWDTCLALEGGLAPGRERFERNAPIAEFLRELPNLAARPVPDELADDIARMAHEIERVDLRPPANFTDFRIHNFGLGGSGELPFPKGGRGLVISPFLVASTIEKLVREHGLRYLVSRPESFADVIARSQNPVLPETCFVLNPGAGLDAQESGDEESDSQPKGPSFDEDRIELTGLHAKLYLFEKSRKAHLFTGSPNATGAAYSHNVEVLIELIGGRKACGIDALLGSDDHPRHDTLRSLLQEYCPSEKPQKCDNNHELKRKAERLAYAIGAARLEATVAATESGQHWDVSLTCDLPPIPDSAQVLAWPSTLKAADSARQIVVPSDSCEEIAIYRDLSLEALTRFFVFEVRLCKGRDEVKLRFVAIAEMVGAPVDRIETITQSVLSDRRRVLQLIFLILSGQGADFAAFLGQGNDREAGAQGSGGGWDQSALLESLLRSLDRDPARIDEAANLIEDLRKTPEGEKLLPDGLEQIWGPVWEARQALK